MSSNFVDPFKVNKGEYLKIKKPDFIFTPIPYTLSQWGDRTEVLYKCPKCGQDFRLLGDKQNYCFNCGIKLDWRFTLKRVTKELSDLYYGYEERYYKGETSLSKCKELQGYLMEELYKFIKEGSSSSQ